ncbi:MAG: LacI family DNA-binding transcriptional regulator [Terrimicrobiaceae bacterium]|nr:LacI family DNA-binding transcriptional regulator [Terrimicrobiaceae bacterium]
MASLKQIAAELGVSYTLVSKVLSGRLGTTGVSVATREAIRQKAAELDYTPNRLAVALKAGRKGAIAVFLHGIGSAGSDVTDRILKGLAEGLEKSGQRMLLRFFMTAQEFVEACDVRLRSEVDGLIVAGAGHPELLPRFRELESKNVKVVSMFASLAGRGLNRWTNAAVDYEMQGYLPAKHLLDKGFRRIACLNTEASRTEGFRRAFSEARLRVSSSQLIRCESFHLEDGIAVADTIRDGSWEAVVCQSDAQAVGLINTLIRQGVRIPEDIRITGIDNSPLAKSCIVPITSVTSEMRPSGLKAVELLLKKIDGQPVESVTLRPKLEVRESSAGSKSSRRSPDPRSR